MALEYCSQLLGQSLFFSVCISSLPQTTELVAVRLSYRSESMAISCNRLGHFLFVVNPWQFHDYDFIVFFHYATIQAVAQIIAVFKCFLQWTHFLPTGSQLFIDDHRAKPPSVAVRDDRVIPIEGSKTVGGGDALAALDAALIAGCVGLSTGFRFEASAVEFCAQVCGSIATALEIGFFVPQIWTICGLRD
jgi:hypothetical protein